MSDVRLKLTPIGTIQQDLTIDAATTITADMPLEANAILINASTQNVRYTICGTDPTAAKGLRLIAGAEPTLIPISDQVTLKVISETPGAGVDWQWVSI